MNKNDSDILKVSGINSKGYGIFPKMVAKDRRLSIEAKSIYAYFCSYAGSGNSAFPKVATILYDLGIGETRYYTHFKLLTEFGYITVEKVRGENGKFDHNIYVLNTEILSSVEEKAPHPQNRGTVNKQDKPYPQNRGTGDRGTGDRGTNINSSKINNLEEEEAVPNKYLEMALKIGATESDLDIALKKMDSEPDIKNPIAWLQKALENEVLNRELANRPKRPKQPKDHKPVKKASAATNPAKYESFYL